MSFLIRCPAEQSHTAPVLSVEAVKIILGEEEGGREGGRKGMEGGRREGGREENRWEGGGDEGKRG